MLRRRVIIGAVLVALSAREAAGDPGDIYHLKSPSTVTTEKGSTLQLPPGYFLDEDTWRLRDAEMRRLQEQETRLKAENQSMRKSLGSHDTKFMAITFAVGAFIGFVGYQSLK